MKPKKIKIGFFPNDFDCLMAPELNDNFEVCYLVAKNSPEEAWAKSFLPNDSIYYYQLNADRTLHSSGYMEIFKYSNILKIIKDNQITHFWLTVNSEDAEYLNNIFSKNKLKLVGIAFKEQLKFENKIWFDSFLKKNKLPKPQSQILNLNKNKLKINGQAVIQQTYSMGGEGTYFFNGPAELKKLNLPPNQKYLVRQFVTGQPLGVTVFVTKSQIALSALRLQCMGDDAVGTREYLGIQWLQTSTIPIAAAKNINEVFVKIGKILWQKKLAGIWNFDFMLTEKNEINIIECNPRLSLATAQIIKFPELISEINISKIFIEEIIKKFVSGPKITKLPKTFFSGSMLEIANLNLKKNHRPTVGIYTQDLKYLSGDIRKLKTKDKNFIFFTMVSAKDKLKLHETIGQVISSSPLFDQKGHLNILGKKLRNYFTY